MTADLMLSALAGPDDDRGRIAAIAVTDQQRIAAGGAPGVPVVLAAGLLEDARFVVRPAPELAGCALADVRAIGDSLWACGERGLLAVSRDHGAHWQRLATGTEAALRALALGGDGAIWVVGDAGYAARVLGEQPRRVELGTAARLARVQAVRDEIVALGDDGRVIRWRDGAASAVACGATGGLRGLAVTAKGTWVVVGTGGFVGRSPDGAWYSRVGSGVELDLEAIGALADGTLVIVGDGGLVLCSTDDARTWRPLGHAHGKLHLWSIARAGAGALIGGDRGLILQLAAVPAGEPTPGPAPKSEPKSAPGAAAEVEVDDTWGAGDARLAPAADPAPAAAALADAPAAPADAPDAPSVLQVAARVDPPAAPASPSVSHVTDPVAPDAAPTESSVEPVESPIAPAAALDEPSVLQVAARVEPPVELAAPAVAPVTELDAAAEREAELARTPVAQWGELAWRWIDDGAAHRALVARLASADPAQHAQIARLQAASADQRVQLATTLAPALEAVLVGSLVRGDALEDVLGVPRAANGKPAASGDADDRERSPGWEAIDRALAAIYGTTEPLHYGTVVPYSLGGNDPIHGISAYPRTEPVPHWHFVTYGFTDLFRKETDDPDESGYGFELTFRLARAAGDAQPPVWALNFLQNLGRYVFSTGNAFAAGHKMGLNGPIALEHDTQITAICFADDPELGELLSELGAARFVQIVGITDNEYKLIQEWSTTGLVEILKQHLPFLVTDLDRRSVLDDPAIAEVIRDRVEREGSSEDLTFAGELALDVAAGQVRIELGALYAATLPRAMRGRIRHGRHYELRGRDATLRLEPSATLGYREDGNDLTLNLTAELAREIEAALRHALAGTYQFAGWSRLTIVVTPSIIRGQDGSATEVRGIADPAEAARLIEEDTARLAAERIAVEQAEAEDDDDEDDDDDIPDPARIAAALAMTTRALRLTPDDEDVQYTHAMLLIDADRAGERGALATLLAALPGFAPGARIAIAVRLAKAGHPRFIDALDLVLGEALPDRVFGGSTASIGEGAAIASFGDITHDLFEELGQAILARSPRHIARLVPLLPDDAKLLSELAHRALEAGERDAALALYDRMVALAIPDGGDERISYLRAFNNACIQSHAARAYDTAARLADRAQPIAHENPHIYHAAACAYAAIHDYNKAFEQVKLAIEHDYEHVAKIEHDTDLGALLEWAEFQTLFRDWHARQEGN